MPLTPQQLADFQRLRQSYAPVVEAQRRKQKAYENLEKMHGLPPVKPQPKAKGGLAKQPLVLYHASDANFDQFDPSMNRTARHIYTSEHPEQAMPYGKHLHTIHATPKMFLDATAEDKSTVAKLKKAAKDAGITDQYYPFEDFHEHFKNGDVYQHSGGQRTMNALLHELFDKHDAIKIPDAIVGGGVGSSVVFKDPKLLKIVNPNNPDITKAKGGKIEVRPTVFDDAASRRNPKIEEAARALLAGNIKQKDYERIVAKEKPVKPYSFIPKPATDEQAMDVLLDRQKQNWRSHESWPAGHRVGLRLDIPAYERHGVWVNSVHDESGEKPARPTSYGPVSSVRNAEFHGSPHKAARVATGEQSKTPFAKIMGNIEHMNEEQAVKHFQKYMNHPDYRQIGYDPRRHGDFYDRETMQPVTHAEHVVQIGPLVLAKKPKYGKRTVYAKGGEVNKAKFLENSKVKDVLYRGGIGHKELPSEFLEGKPRAGYATFASTSPHVAGSYAHTDESESEHAGGIAPMHINAHTLHEFPVTVNKHGSRSFDKFAFDRFARQLQPGHAVVARKVIDYGPRASTKTDPQKLYSHPSDVYAWGKGTQTKSALSKAHGGRVTHAHHLEIEERPL